MRHFPITFFGLLLMGITMVGSAAPLEDEFNQGNTAFVTEKYTEAIQHYEALIAGHHYSAPIFYNLGNSCFRAGKMGPAILNYERALWLTPRDPDIKANLQFVRQHIGLFPPTESWWQSLANHFSLNSWCWTAALTFALICLVLGLRIQKMDSKWSLRPVLFILLFTWMLVLICIVIRFSEQNRAVVMVAETPLKVAPLDASPSSFNLAEGSLVEIEKDRESFFYIRSQDGKMGWVAKSQIAKIVESSSSL